MTGIIPYKWMLQVGVIVLLTLCLAEARGCDKGIILYWDVTGRVTGVLPYTGM